DLILGVLLSVALFVWMWRYPFGQVHSTASDSAVVGKVWGVGQSMADHGSVRKVAVVHLTLREGMSSVFMAQIVKPMGMLKARGRDVSLVAFAPPGEFLRQPLRRRWRDLRHEVYEAAGLGVTNLLSPPS